MPHIIQSAVATTAFFRLFHGGRRSNRRVPRLDLNALPDDLKRDLGFLGGRASPPRDVLRD